MDALTEVIDSLRVTQAHYVQSNWDGPWVFRGRNTKQPTFHCVLEGSATLRADRQPAAEPLDDGDLVLLPRGDAHVLEGKHTTLLGSGQLHYPAAHQHPVLRALPAVVCVRRGAEGAPDLALFLGLLHTATRDATLGTEVVQNRLCDALFAQVLGAYWGGTGARSRGWLAALVDAQIGPALQSIHRDPGAPFTVESLAAQVGMSRSAFAWRFVELVGEPPLRYIGRLRMHTAASLLQDARVTLTTVATRVGYDSEAAFSRAFKRHLGCPPGLYRRRSRSAAALHRDNADWAEDRARERRAG